MELGKAYVRVIPSTQGIGGTLGNELSAAAGPAGTQAGNTMGEKMKTSLSSKMKNVGKGLVAAGAIATAVSVPIVNGIKDAMSAYQVQSAAETKLTEIYKTRMGVSEEVAKKTMELASAIQQEGVIGDEVTLSGAQQLATFAQYPETVNTLLPAMDNLLAQQKGLNATTDDAVNIGNLMGKVMQGQTGALKRVGISFTDAQEEVLKYGTEQERAAMLAEVITSNVGNMNAEMANTPEGKMQQLSNTMGDLKERIGGALAPVLADVATYVSEKIVPAMEKIIGFAEGHPIISKIVLGLTAVLAIGGPLAMLIGTMIIAVGSLTAATTALNISLLPVITTIGLVVLAVAAAIAISVLLYKNWDKIKKMAIKLWEKIRSTIVEKVRAIKTKITEIWGTIKQNISDKLTSIKTTAVNIWKSVKDGVEDKVGAVKEYLSNTWELIKTTAKKAWEKVKEKIIDPIKKAKQTVSDTIEKLKKLFPINIGRILKGIKTPYITLKWKSKDFGKLGTLKWPTGFTVGWHAKGGIFDAPTIAGIGEAGPEAVVPLDAFWAKMDENRVDYELLAAAILAALRGANMTNELVVDGRVVARSVSPFLQDELEKQQNRTNRRLGMVY